MEPQDIQAKVPVFEPVDPPAGGAPPPQPDSFVKSFIPPKRKITKVLPTVLALFLITVLPLAVFLVKQKEAPMKAEVSPGVVTDKCGHVTLGPAEESYDSTTSTYTLAAPIKNNRDYSVGVKLRWETWYCADKDREICDQNGQTFEEEVTLASQEQKVLKKSVKQELGDDRGSLQIDLVVLSINGDTSCHTVGEWKNLIWGLYRTDRDCEEGPTPPPGAHPSCSGLDGLSSVAPGDIITFTAHPSGSNLNRVEFWLMSEKDKNEHGFCPPSEWAPKVWILIDKDIDGSNGWSAQWNTTGYSEGKYFVAVNIYSVYGDENWWCTGNPEGPCNDDSKGVSCPDCSKWVTLTTEIPTPTPTSEVTPTPTPTLSPTPVPTAPPTYTCICGQVTSDRDLKNLKIGDVVKFTGFGKTNYPQAIKTIKFMINKGGKTTETREVTAGLGREEGGWKFYKADFSFVVPDYGDYEIGIQIECPQGWQD